MWRAFDDSVTLMLRLDTPLDLHHMEGKPGHDLLARFQPSLRNLVIYLERGASVPPLLPWSVGRITVEHERSSGFLHRVLDDPFGLAMATMFRPAQTQSDLTLTLVLYEAQADKLTFAVRDYDIGV